MIRVVVADDHTLLRESFRLLIDSTEGLTVVGEAGTGAEAVEVCRRERPDVALLDVRMPQMDGIEATRQLCTHPSTSSVRVLILTTFDLDEYVFSALRAGASGFLLKDTSAADLLAAIRTVAGGQALLAPTVTQRLIAAFVQQPPTVVDHGPDGRSATGPQGGDSWSTGLRVGGRLDHGRTTGVRTAVFEQLTAREREVLVLVAQGRSNTELAAELHLSPATIKTHIGRLLSKLHARDRAQLVITAYESGLVTPRPEP